MKLKNDVILDQQQQNQEYRGWHLEKLKLLGKRDDMPIILIIFTRTKNQSNFLYRNGNKTPTYTKISLKGIFTSTNGS